LKFEFGCLKNIWYAQAKKDSDFTPNLNLSTSIIAILIAARND